MKILNSIKKSLIAAIASAGVCTTLGVADPSDHTVVIRTEQTVKQLVREELQSVRFAEQIAAYNGMPNASTVLAVGTTLAIPRPYLDSLDFGRIAFVKGDVRHSQTNLVVNPPGKGSHVFDGDVLETGSDGFVSLVFNSGARVNVQPESRIIVNDIQCIKVSVKCVIDLSATKGQVHSEVVPAVDGQPPVQFSIDTPFLTAAVRGTAFYVDVDQKENRIGVTKGLVATASAGAQNDLPKGKGLSAKPGVVAEVVDLLDPPVLGQDSDVILFSEEDSLSWSAIDGAKRYEANFATDSTMSESQLVEQTEGLLLSPALSPGDYHVTVAAIDDNEFLGLPAKAKISYAEISETQQPEITIVRRGGTVELSMPGYSGAAQLFIGESEDSFTITTVANASEKLQLELPENREWVFKTRKILGTHKVSAYSDFYVLSARKR